MGKGDTYRKVDPKKWDRGWNLAFNRCSRHPEYQVVREPRVDCPRCWALWKRKLEEERT